MAKHGAERWDSGPEGEGPRGLVTLCTYDHPIPARLALGYLTDHEIPTFLKDENAVAITGLPALGGIKLQVPASAEAEARELLQALETAEALPEDFEPPEDEAGAAEAAADGGPNVLALVGLLLALAAVIVARVGTPGVVAGGLALAFSVLGLVRARRGAGRGLGAALAGLLLSIGAVVGALLGKG